MDRNKRCCKNCKCHAELRRWDYSKLPGEFPKSTYDGFACAAFLFEGEVIHMIGLDDETEICEMFAPRIVAEGEEKTSDT